MKNIISLLLLLSFLLQACSNNSGNNKIPEVTAFRNGPLDSIYSKLRPAIQVFTINNNQVNVIKALKGTEILIPADCFENGNGDVVSGEINVEIVEAFSLQDFITGGLATASGDKLIVSNGMMYINAKAGSTKLQLSKGASISVSMPTINNNDGFQMFTGDGRNWKVDSTMVEPEYAIPLPLNLLYPEGNKYFWHCFEYWDGPKEKIAYYDTSIVSVTDSKYENTIIATDEFRRREMMLRGMTSKISYFVNSDYYFDKTDCFGEKYNYDLYRVYFENPKRSFHVSDSIIKGIYIDYFAKNHEKMAVFCNEVNKHKQEYYSNWTDTNYYFDFRKISMKDDYMEVLKYFPPANTKEIKQINDHGINLNAANAYDILKAKGIEIKEINEILTYNFRRQSLIKILQRKRNAIYDKQQLSVIYETTVFSVTKLGWINCDLFYNDPAAGPAEIFVSDGSANRLDYIDFSLVIPDMSVKLSSFQVTPESYTFTKQTGPFTNLPIGKPAVIVGVSMKHDSIFFGSKKIVIKNGLKISLPMKYTSISGLKDSLLSVLAINQAD